MYYSELLTLDRAYAPSTLEKQAIELLIKGDYLSAMEYYDRAIIEDPRRILRIREQWEGEYPLLEGYQGYSLVDHALKRKDKSLFSEALKIIYQRQGERLPEDMDTVFQQAFEQYWWLQEDYYSNSGSESDGS